MCDVCLIVCESVKFFVYQVRSLLLLAFGSTPIFFGLYLLSEVHLLYTVFQEISSYDWLLLYCYTSHYYFIYGINGGGYHRNHEILNIRSVQGHSENKSTRPIIA